MLSPLLPLVFPSQTLSHHVRHFRASCTVADASGRSPGTNFPRKYKRTRKLLPVLVLNPDPPFLAFLISLLFWISFYDFPCFSGRATPKSLEKKAKKTLPKSKEDRERKKGRKSQNWEALNVHFATSTFVFRSGGIPLGGSK